MHCAVIYIPAYFYAVGLLQGEGLARSHANLCAEWRVTYTSCTLLWVPFMAATFAYVPAAHRVRWVACANVVWNVVIDYIAHRGEVPPHSQHTPRVGKHVSPPHSE